MQTQLKGFKLSTYARKNPQAGENKRGVTVHFDGAGWKGISPFIIRAVLDNSQFLRELMKKSDTELIAMSDAMELANAKIAGAETFVQSATQSVDVPVVSTPATQNTGQTYRDGTFADFTTWMTHTYDVTAEQARVWMTDSEYQKEFQAYLSERKQLARPAKRAETVATRPVKRMTTDEIAQKSAEMKEHETKESAPKPRGIPVNFAIVVNGKTVNMDATSKSNAIDKLHSLDKELTNAKGEFNRVIANADTIRANGGSPSHMFDALVKAGYVTLK